MGLLLKAIFGKWDVGHKGRSAGFLHWGKLYHMKTFWASGEEHTGVGDHQRSTLLSLKYVWDSLPVVPGITLPEDFQRHTGQ